MKYVYAPDPTMRRKQKRRTKWKAIAKANIAQRYMELLRLRAMVQEVEARPHAR